MQTFRMQKWSFLTFAYLLARVHLSALLLGAPPITLRGHFISSIIRSSPTSAVQASLWAIFSCS